MEKEIDTMTQAVIDSLEQGVKPWEAGWDRSPLLPYNPSTGKLYRGSNILRLLQSQQARGIADPRWLTFKQAKSLDAQVQRGEKASYVIFFTPKSDQNKKTGEEEKKPVSSEPVIIKLQRERDFVYRRTAVFNGAQMSGLAPVPERLCSWSQDQVIETILTALNVEVVESSEGRCCYYPGRDVIEMALRSKFQSSASYAASLLHELVHWTAHPSRLDRPLVGYRENKEQYAKEELVADLGAFFLGKLLGISNQLEHHASYIDSWLKLLSKDKREVSIAAAKAQKAVDFFLENVPGLKDSIESALKAEVKEDC